MNIDTQQCKIEIGCQLPDFIHQISPYERMTTQNQTELTHLTKQKLFKRIMYGSLFSILIYRMYLFYLSNVRNKKK